MGKHSKVDEDNANTISFYLENDNHEEVDFNGETLTFTSQMIKISTTMFKFCVYTHLYDYCLCMFIFSRVIIIVCLHTFT